MCNKCKLQWLVQNDLAVPPPFTASPASSAEDVFELTDRNHRGDDKASLDSLIADLETLPLGDLFIYVAKAAALANLFGGVKNTVLDVLADRAMIEYADALKNYTEEPKHPDNEGIRGILKEMGVDLPDDAEITEIRIKRPDDE